MNTKLLKKLDEFDAFATKLDNEINPKEEVLFTLIQLLDMRDDREVSDESFNRLIKKVGIKMVTDESLYEEYMVSVGLVIEALMEMLLGNLENQELSHTFLREIGENFANALSDDEFNNVIDELTQKIKMLSENEEIMSSDEIAPMITQFTAPEFMENFLQRNKQEVIAGLLGLILSLIPILGMFKMGGFDFDEESLLEEFGLEEQIRAGFRETPSNEKIHDPRGLAYSLGTKAICNLCDKEYAPKGIKRHLNSCIEKHCGHKKEELLYLVIKSHYSDYFLHISIKSHARLADLDAYLRDAWLECCGHMSGFSIGRNELDMSMSVDEVFFRTPKVEYIYDFGSSTYLHVKHVKTFKGEQLNLIETLSRNPMPKLKCSSCGSTKVVAICTECSYEGTGNLCKKCLPKHGCNIDMARPYVNSPRYAECGYGEWDNTHGFSEEEFDKIYDEVEKNG